MFSLLEYDFIAIFLLCSNRLRNWNLKFKIIAMLEHKVFNSQRWNNSDMEVKLSISSSRRISFASDFKDFDLEVEELEKERDNPSYRGRVNYNSDSDDDVETNYVNLARIYSCFVRLSRWKSI